MSPAEEEGFVQIARKALPLVFRVSPVLFVFEYAVTVLDALLLVLTTATLRDFFDHVSGLAAGWFRLIRPDVVASVCLLKVRMKRLMESLSSVSVTQAGATRR